jgi:hypothetical protein
MSRSTRSLNKQRTLGLVASCNSDSMPEMSPGSTTEKNYPLALPDRNLQKFQELIKRGFLPTPPHWPTWRKLSAILGELDLLERSPFDNYFCYPGHACERDHLETFLDQARSYGFNEPDADTNIPDHPTYLYLGRLMLLERFFGWGIKMIPLLGGEIPRRIEPFDRSPARVYREFRTRYKEFEARYEAILETPF